MSEAFDILMDTKICLAETEASLTLATHCPGPGAVEFRQQALSSANSAIKRLRELEKVIEHDLCNPA